MEIKLAKGVWVTLYILDTNMTKKEIKKYLIFSSICLIFSSIYEVFSHQVYSMFMICAFLIPLILGAGIYFILLKKNKFFNNISNELYKMSLYTFTFGSLMKGVLDIYGTTNSKLLVYLIIGGILFGVAIILQVLKKISYKWFVTKILHL